MKRGTANGPMNFLTWYRDGDDRDGPADARGGEIDTHPRVFQSEIEEVARRRHGGRTRARVGAPRRGSRRATRPRRTRERRGQREGGERGREG